MDFLLDGLCYLFLLFVLMLLVIFFCRMADPNRKSKCDKTCNIKKLKCVEELKKPKTRKLAMYQVIYTDIARESHEVLFTSLFEARMYKELLERRQTIKHATLVSHRYDVEIGGLTGWQD